MILEAGADRFVDLEQEHREEAVGHVDLIYDLIGGDVQARAIAIIKPGGGLVTVVSPPPETRKNSRTVDFIRDPSRAQLMELGSLVDTGRLHAQVGAVYPLADTQTAFAAEGSHRIPGKVILQP